MLLALALASRRDDDELGRLEPWPEAPEASKPFSFLLPEPQAGVKRRFKGPGRAWRQDLSEVEHFGGTLGPAEQVQTALAQDPGGAAALLQRLSGQRREASDGHDRRGARWEPLNCLKGL